MRDDEDRVSPGGCLSPGPDSITLAGVQYTSLDHPVDLLARPLHPPGESEASREEEQRNEVGGGPQEEDDAVLGSFVGPGSRSLDPVGAPGHVAAAGRLSVRPGGTPDKRHNDTQC